MMVHSQKSRLRKGDALRPLRSRGCIWWFQCDSALFHHLWLNSHRESIFRCALCFLNGCGSIQLILQRHQHGSQQCWWHNQTMQGNGHVFWWGQSHGVSTPGLRDASWRLGASTWTWRWALCRYAPRWRCQYHPVKSQTSQNCSWQWNSEIVSTVAGASFATVSSGGAAAVCRCPMYYPKLLVTQYGISSISV
jgi:hypothetical protein